MELEFWHQRWHASEIGFHQDKVNPYLLHFYGVNGPDEKTRRKLKVFVPLCGKSDDMFWLASQGYGVIGVECSEIAVRDFFNTHGLTHDVIEDSDFMRFQSEAVEIMLGDFFKIEPSHIDQVTDIYDRASLIAMPEIMRKEYAEKMADIQKSGTRTLLITLSYPQQEMDGPPFSVTEDEVEDLYGDKFKIEKLLVKDILDQEKRFRERGLTSLKETAYKLTRV